jgi:hypothetical protein
MLKKPLGPKSFVSRRVQLLKGRERFVVADTQ